MNYCYLWIVARVTIETQLNNIKPSLKIKNKNKLSYLASHANLVCIQEFARTYEQFCTFARTFYWSRVESNCSHASGILFARDAGEFHGTCHSANLG